MHWSCVGAGLAADNRPIDGFEIDVGNWAEERLEGYEFYGGGSLPEVVYAEGAILIFYSDPHPYILQPRKIRA